MSSSGGAPYRPSGAGPRSRPALFWANRNIALTGRYGSGQSSVLDDFQKKHDKDIVTGMLFGLILTALWAVRWFIGDRIVSEVTTAGTKIALGAGPTTYFDGILDEIVAFFDTVKPKFVIFEDLNRFEDPQIFDSLPELTTLVNASANWKVGNEPLRFISAIKDSLFEQLGAEPESKDEKDEEGKPKEGEAKPVIARVPRTALCPMPNPDTTLLPRPFAGRTRQIFRNR